MTSPAGDLVNIVRNLAAKSPDQALATAANALAGIYEQSWKLTAELVESFERINEKAKGVL